MNILKMILLWVAASFGLTYGFVTSFRNFKRLESTEDSESLLTWVEGPHRTLFLNISHGFLAVFNNLTIVVMASLLLVCAIQYDGQDLSPYLDKSWYIVLITVITGQVGLSFWVAGTTLVSLVISITKRRIRVTLSPSGIRWGIVQLPWSSFNHFDSESSPSRLYFYSAYNPDLYTLSILPPQRTIREQTVSIAARYLPDTKQIDLTEGKHLKGQFYIEHCGLCIAGLTISILLFRISTLWSQFLQMTFVLLFIFANNAINKRYISISTSANAL